MRYKHDYDKALYRLTQIIAKLYQGARLSNIELAEEFGVSTKTIQRDFIKLVSLFPIYQEKKLWQMESNFEFEENLSLEDDITMKLLLEISKSFDKNFQDSASKLLSRINDNIKSPIYTKIDLENISHKLKDIQIIEEAINKSQQIKFSYLKEDEYIDIAIEPYKIVNFDSFWYLVGKRKSNLRRYYLQNIFDVEIEEIIFKKSKKIDDLINNAINIWFDDNNSFEVKLLINNSIEKYFMRKPISPTQRYIGHDENNNMIITLQITHENEIFPIVKYWMPNIKILEPKEMNEKLKKDIEKFIMWT